MKKIKTLYTLTPQKYIYMCFVSANLSGSNTKSSNCTAKMWTLRKHGLLVKMYNCLILHQCAEEKCSCLTQWTS